MTSLNEPITWPLKICHTVALLNGKIAGAENHLRLLLPQLAKNSQLRVDLVALTPPSKQQISTDVLRYLEDIAQAGVKVWTLPIRGYKDLSAPFKLARLLKEIQPDVLHTHMPHADLFGPIAGRLARGRLARTALILSTRHNDDAFRSSRWYSASAFLFMRMVDHVIAISDAVKKNVILCDHLPESKVTTIHYGFASESFVSRRRPQEVRQECGVQEEAPLAGIVARLAEQKNHQVLLAAWQQVISRLPEARLLIVGDGPLRSELTKQVDAYGIRDSVIFLGWRNDIADLLHALDLFVLSSKHEGFGLVLLEAMAAQKPIVATRVSAIPEVVQDGETGLLVSPTDLADDGADATALAKAIHQLLADPERAKKMGQAGHKRLKSQFTVERMADKTYNLYLKLLTERAGRRLAT